MGVSIAIAHFFGLSYVKINKSFNYARSRKYICTYWVDYDNLN
jgi:hypothetical protein